MRQSIVILVLSVIVIVLSGCEKIKTELERRHLRSEIQKTSTSAALDELKTFNNKQNDVETPSTRKQIVLRIDLPTDEKIQIRLIKSPVPEAAPESVAPAQETSPKEMLKEAASLKEEKPLDKSEKSVESDKEKEKSTEKTDSKDEKSKSEIKTDLDQEPEPEPEKETHREESPLPRNSVPTVVVPGREIESKPALPDEQVQKSLSRPEPSEMAPAEKAVGIAIGISPEEIAPVSRESLNAAPAASKPSSSNPWAIPDAEYPLGYY